MVVVEAEHATTHRGEVSDRGVELLAEFGTQNVGRWTRMGGSDTLLVYLMQRLGVVGSLAEVVTAHVFSNAVKPRVKR